VKLAVFTSRYPAQVATFFERDMRSLLEAGVEIDVFAVAPLDASLWKHSLALLGPDQLPRERLHHLRLLESVRGAVTTLARGGRVAVRDAGAILKSAVRHGVVPFAKSAYVLPKAWAWAARDRDYDHVLAYWGNYAGSCAYAFHRLATPNVPFSIWLHAGTDLYFRPVFMREKLLYADNIITCCEFNVNYMAREFADIAPQISSKIFVCHHGLDLGTFAYRPLDRPTNRILAVGRLSKEKGYNYLLRAAQQLSARGVHTKVDFIGHGPEERNLVALAQQLGVSDRVRFRGWLPFAEVRQAMSEATVLVHPSNGLGDGLPNVIREAMAVGTPVIASDVAGIPDALSDGCGVLVPPTDVDALAAAIADVLGDSAQRMTIAARARQRVEERYDLWRNGSRLASLLQSTLRRRSTQSAPAPAPAPVPVASGTRSKRFYDLIALDLMLTRPPGAFDHDDLDWSELRLVAQRGGALVRVADAVSRPGEPLPARFAEVTAQACRQAQQVVDLVDQLGAACTRLGIAHAFVRTAESYPDAQRTIDLLVGDPSPRVDREITRDLHAARHRGALHHRLAGASTYSLPYGNRLLIRHGRLGRLGEHARFARQLLARARPRAMGTASPHAPTPADHVLLLAMHQLYTRPEFRLSDLHGAIDALRGPQMDWDYLFATALSTATVPAVGCYLQYLDRIYQSVTGRALVPDDVLRRFAARVRTTGPALAQDARFPRTWSAARLYLQHLRATLASGRWHSAARLSLVPVLAAWTAGTRRMGGLA
jgi:glycosyltransferase involved in cell wall biosynthesis